MSRRDDTTVAWHEVPGTAPSPKSRPVGYGVISSGVRTDSIRCDRVAIKRLKFMLCYFAPTIKLFSWQLGVLQVQETLHYIEQQVEHHWTRTFQEEYLAFLKKTRRTFRRKIPLGLGAPDHIRLGGDGSFPGHAFPGTACQAAFVDYGAPENQEFAQPPSAVAT